MKNLIIAAVMSVSLLFSISAMAQDTKKDNNSKAKTECKATDKKKCCKEDKKECTEKKGEAKKSTKATPDAKTDCCASSSKDKK